MPKNSAILISHSRHSPRDSIISIALSSQVTAWKVRNTFEQRAARVKVEDLTEILTEILANAPDTPQAPGDEWE